MRRTGSHDRRDAFAGLLSTGPLDSSAPCVEVPLSAVSFLRLSWGGRTIHLLQTAFYAVRLEVQRRSARTSRTNAAYTAVCSLASGAACRTSTIGPEGKDLSWDAIALEASPSTVTGDYERLRAIIVDKCATASAIQSPIRGVSAGSTHRLPAVFPAKRRDGARNRLAGRRRESPSSDRWL